ncbi:TPA: hypothetical protein EYG84_02460 [Candidatus Gracilibacteria bacterium]|nr:hypothetical protein [Candidatus Gracilibacteria bacterium]
MNPTDYFLLGSGITAILFVVFWVYKKGEVQKKEEYFKTLELENFEIKTENQLQKHEIQILETEKIQREEKLFDKLEKLEYSRIALESEKNRMIRVQEEEAFEKEEKKYKQWVEHENNVIFKIKNICKNLEFNFDVFDNTNLPLYFDMQLKPDCMVEFLGQYIVFDAKKSKNPKTYIAEQVKNTAKKYSESEVFEKIYSTIFFVMPDSEITQLKQTIFQDSGYTFLVISEKSLVSVFYFLKKISQYENLENFNPQERENLVNLIATYDTHISYQNAVNFVLAKQSFDINNIKNHLPVEFISDVKLLQNKTKKKIINQAEVLKYAGNKNLQKKEISNIINPQSVISFDIMKNSENLYKKI